MGEKRISHNKAQTTRKALWSFCAFLWLILVSTAHAEIIDRIVAVIDTHIITLSDLRQEREIRGRLGEKPIEDDKVLAHELIDKYLIESQITDFADVDVSNDEVDAELQKSIGREGVPSDAVRDTVRRRIRMRKYIDFRFRQSIRPTDEDVRKYYDDVFVPAAKGRGLSPIPPLVQVSDAVRNNVIQESLDHEVNVWLEAIRRRGNIEIFQ